MNGQKSGRGSWRWSRSPAPNGTSSRNGTTPERTNPPEPNPPEPEELSTLDKGFAEIKKSLASLRLLKRAYEAPLPTQTGDGSYIPPAPPKETLWGEAVKLLADIGRQDIKTLASLEEFIQEGLTGQPMNDRQYLMEALVTFASTCPEDNVQKKITGTFLTKLWGDLQHPPQTLLGDRYKFRMPDGSGNNYQVPHIGAAGMPYARSVEPKTERQACLPDPGVLFDTLMARKQPQKHPNYVSSTLFYLASIIIHDVFRTNRADYNISDTSSYLDLAPLYGSNWREQKQMRTMKDGKIHPDCFSETRLLTFPPGVGAILIMFNRYHNYVAEQLALINQDGRFSLDENPKKRKAVRPYGEQGADIEVDRRDDDLFQTARLITCGLYVNIILIDYVRTILNLNRTDSNWQLDPRLVIKDGPPVGTGNQVAAEFNLVYRWHSAVSDKDDKWTQQLFQELPLPADLKKPGVDISEHMDEFLKVLGDMEMHVKKEEPNQRDWPALKSERLHRDKDGRFKDDDLAAILTSGIEDCANAMGPQQVPVIMKAIEVLGIQQARTWNCATLNEMRIKFGLQPYRNFEDITTNRDVSDALKHLYDTPDQVELYPGLVVEDAKDPKRPGSGLCPSFTTSRGVLSDAVALVRGDRFHTTAHTPALLTNWGFKECATENDIDNGCVFYKLFLRALPNNYDPQSVYVHYPLTVPKEMENVLKRLGKAHKYNFDVPTPLVQTKVAFSYNACVSILNDQQRFHVTWGDAMKRLMGPKAGMFMLAGDKRENSESRVFMEKFLYTGSAPGASRKIPSPKEGWLKSVRAFYEDTTTRLLKEKMYKLGDLSQVDIVRDVGNMVHVHFAAEMFHMPLKTGTDSHEVFSEQQLYLIMAAMFICVFFDLDPPKSFPLRMKAFDATQAISNLMKLQIEALKYTGRIGENVMSYFDPQAPTLKQYGAHMLLEMVKAEPDVDKLVISHIMGTVAGMVANQGQLFAQVLDFFLKPENAEHLRKVKDLADRDTPEADDQIMHYLMEAARLNGETGVFRYVQEDITIEDKSSFHDKKTGSTRDFNRKLELKKGDKVMVNLRAAGRDPVAFPNPDQVDLTRPLDKYVTFSHGPHQCIGLPMTRVALSTMLKVIVRLEGLRPAKMSIGRTSCRSETKKVIKEFLPGDMADIPEEWHYHLFLTEKWDSYFPFPTSLKVNWDGDVPEF